MKFYLVTKAKENEQIVKQYLNEIGEVVPSISDCDVIVSIGGDGTLLQVGKLAIENDKPLIGINAGHLGYLCAFKIEEISKLKIDDFVQLKETKRTLIEYNGKVAINDICVLKGNPVQSIEVEVKNVAFWKGDGVIVSTATGSSSYNQAAGGPLLEPSSSDLIVTPICPHFSKQGYKVIKDKQVEIFVNDRTPALLSVDNEIIGPIAGPVVIKKSLKQLRLLTK